MLFRYFYIHRYLLIGCIFTMLFCSGCYSLTELNDTAVCTGLGADLNQNKEMSFTFQLAKPIEPRQTGMDKNQTVVFSSTGKTVVEAARKSSLFLPRLPLYSHARLFIIGEQLGIYTPIHLGELIYTLTTPGIETLIPMVTILKKGKRKNSFLMVPPSLKAQKWWVLLTKNRVRGITG